MKNRTLPYGYQCRDGVVIPHPQESEIVRRICNAYLDGQSLFSIATRLNEEQVEYMPGVTGWNKARIKRILEDKRYLGSEPYPALITEAVYTAIQEIKYTHNTQKETNRKSDIFHLAAPVLCPACGRRMLRRQDSRCETPQRWTCEGRDCRLRIEIADRDLLEAIQTTLAHITPERIQKVKASNTEPSAAVQRLNREIARLLNAGEIDKEALRKKALDCIRQKYHDLDPNIYTTKKLQADFERASTTDYKQLISRTVREIILYTDRTTGLVLLNGQLIR